MKIEIKNLWTNEIMFSEKATDLKALCVTLVKRGADLGDANLGDADLRDANLRGANLYSADLRGANLYGADLRGANLRDADLGDANLGDADLRGANLRDADLRGANLYGADLRGANLRGANLGENVVIQLGPLGSRKDYLVVIHTKGKTEYRAGCFVGSAVDLRKTAVETHGNNQHGKEYAAAIDLCEMLLSERRREK